MTDRPRIRSVGLSGLLVTFAEKMSEPANRAALAFRAAVEEQDWPEVRETSTSLVSTFVQPYVRGRNSIFNRRGARRKYKSSGV